MSLNPVDTDSYVVYQSKKGGSYHLRPACAAKPDTPTALDKGANVLEKVNMYRVREIKATDKTLCSNCTGKLRNAMGLSSGVDDE